MAGHPPDSTLVEVAFPTLTPADLERLRSYGTVREVAAGDLLFVPGQRDYDFFVLIDAVVTILQRDGDREAALASHGAGRFLGELNMLTGSQLMVSARVERSGRVLQVPHDSFRRLLRREAGPARTIVDAFLARRAILTGGLGARSLQILGSRFSPEALRLRQFVARQRLPHAWEDLEERADVEELLARAGVEPSDIPVVITPTGVLRRPTPADLADALGLSYRPAPDDRFDMAVVGAGPAGLAAAVYAASEGLSVLALDAAGPGGQAGASSLIENYLGFPSGISGRDLTDRAAAQAQKFGVRLTSPCDVVSLTAGPEFHVLTLGDGATVAASVVVVATGARYRRLPVPDWDRFEGAGIYYAATELEARLCESMTVAVVGGGNSAGQAAMFLAEHAGSVRVLVRRNGLADTMSRYLVDRIEAHPRITVCPRTQVTGVHGDQVLRQVSTVDAGGLSQTEDCAGLFCFIGADAGTGWLPPEVRLGAGGFVLTDRDLRQEGQPSDGRDPLPYESSVPGVFAVGDVRHGSTKRVAAAVGEGGSAVHSAHRYLAAHRPTGR
jgi:thioredoxin reductase (NADPH)